MGSWQGKASITAREDLSPDYFRLRLRAPELAAGARPGLFANLLIGDGDLCLRRPISFHDADGEQVSMIIGVTGRGTAWLRQQRVGAELDVMGPLGGRSLSLLPGARSVALVGGGVGIPPLHFVAKRALAAGPAPRFTVFIGARSAERLLCADEFASLGVDVVTSTDDGSAGYQGTAVAALEHWLERHAADQVLTCGPTPMMRAAAELAIARGLPSQVCLEARMACGVGACLSCVVETRREGWERYQRVCTEGPVFDGAEVVWETLSPLCAL